MLTSSGQKYSLQYIGQVFLAQSLFCLLFTLIALNYLLDTYQSSFFSSTESFSTATCALEQRLVNLNSLSTSLIDVYLYPFIYVFALVTILSIVFCLSYSKDESFSFMFYCQVILFVGYLLFFTSSFIIFFFAYEMLLVPSFFILYKFAKTILVSLSANVTNAPHILLTAELLWFFFIACITVVRWCNLRVKPQRETRGVRRSRCAELITALVPVSWAASTANSEARDPKDNDWVKAFSPDDEVKGQVANAGELAEGSLTLPPQGSKFFDPGLLHLNSPAAKAKAMEDFENFTKTFFTHSKSPSYEEAVFEQLQNLGHNTLAMQLFATCLSISLFIRPFVTPAYSERTRIAFARNGTTAILLVLCLLPDLGYHYAVHGVLAILFLQVSEYLKGVWFAPSPVKVIGIASALMLILVCLSFILRDYTTAECLSIVACALFLLLRCSGLIDRERLCQELDRIAEARGRKLVFLYLLTHVYGCYDIPLVLLPCVTILLTLGVLYMITTPRLRWAEFCILWACLLIWLSLW